MPSERAISSSETVSMHQIASEISASGMPCERVSSLEAPATGRIASAKRSKRPRRLNRR